MQGLCKKHSLEVQFIDAIDGADLSAGDISQVTSKLVAIEQIGRELASGEIGCALSHFSIYQQVVDEGIQHAIILEDDIELDKNFKKVISLVDSFPDNWELVLLGYNDQVTDKELLISLWHRGKLTESHSIVRLARPGYGSYGYMLSLVGAIKLVKKLSVISMPIDHYTGVDTHINLYALFPRIVRPYVNHRKESNLMFDRALNQDKKIIHPESTVKVILKRLGLFKMAKRVQFFYDSVKLLRNYD